MSGVSAGLSRRQLLIGGVAFAALVRAPLAKAQIPPAIGLAVQIGQLAVGAAKLFQSTSTNDRTEVILRVLSEISAQITAVQQGIAAILRGIEEVKRLVGDLPAAVVEQLSQANLQASVLAYDELLRTRAQYGPDETRFINERRREVESLIDRIRSHRNILFTYDNYLNLPILATALHIEYQCMRLIIENDQRIVPVTQTYKTYFRRILYGQDENLVSRIAAIRAERLAALGLLNQPQYEVMKVIPWGQGYWQANIGYSMQTLGPAPAVQSIVPELIQLGLITPAEQHIAVRTVSEMRYPARNLGATSQEYTGGNAYPPVIRPAANEPSRGDRIAAIESERAALENRHNIAVDRLYIAVTCLHAGDRALNFTQQFA